MKTAASASVGDTSWLEAGLWILAFVQILRFLDSLVQRQQGITT